MPTAVRFGPVERVAAPNSAFNASPPSPDVSSIQRCDYGYDLSHTSGTYSVTVAQAPTPYPRNIPLSPESSYSDDEFTLHHQPSSTPRLNDDSNFLNFGSPYKGTQAQVLSPTRMPYTSLPMGSATPRPSYAIMPSDTAVLGRPLSNDEVPSSNDFDSTGMHRCIAAGLKYLDYDIGASPQDSRNAVEESDVISPYLDMPATRDGLETIAIHHSQLPVTIRVTAPDAPITILELLEGIYEGFQQYQEGAKLIDCLTQDGRKMLGLVPVAGQSNTWAIASGVNARCLSNL
ncbi:hypothetical protein DXG01_015251 [Tephrocybe rancida]|nr:hypothetical protein DXG01_015251 [Tephrocybe rancida]